MIVAQREADMRARNLTSLSAHLAKMRALSMREASLASALLAGVVVFAPAPVNAADSRLSFPKQFSISAKGVNVQTGRYMKSVEDLKIGPFALRRSWGELPSYPIVRGFGTPLSAANQALQWTHNFLQGQYLDGNDSIGSLYIFVVDGNEYRFRIDINSNFLAQDKSTQGSRIEQTPPQWKLIDRQGSVYIFEPVAGTTNSTQKYLTSATYPNGSRLLYTYNAAGQVRTVISNLGYALVFDYNAQANLAVACGYNLTVTRVTSSSTCAGASLKATYGYDATGAQLTTVTDALNGVVTINYTVVGNAPLPTCITFRNSAACEVTNEYATAGLLLPDQVIKQTMATDALTPVADVWSYNYVNGEDPIDVPIVAGQPRWTRATIVDGAGQNFGMRFDRGQLVESSSPQGTFVYRYPQYGYIPPSATSFGVAAIDFRGTLPRLITTPDGDAEYYEHNTRGEVTKKVTLPKGTNIFALTTTGGGTLIPADPNLALCCTTIDPLVVPAGSIVVSQNFLPDWGGTGLYGQDYVMGCGQSFSSADDKRCSKPISQIDANGNQTDFDYSAIHGGILTETGPAPTPGGVRPQTRYTYVQRQAFILGAGSTVVAAGPPVWLLASKSICKTSQWTGSACAVANDEVRTDYEYGPTSGLNNLNLRGEVVDATGMALRTCYAYNWRAQRTSVTTPRAGLGVCP
jgi:hypothetical protein